MALSSFSVSAKGLDGIPYRVDVNGGGTAVTGDGQFLRIEGGEEQDRGLDPVWPKRLRLFMREDVDLSPLFGEADRAVDVAVQNVTGGTDTLVYRGFMVTDFYSDAPFEPKPLIELQALDGLGTLENDSLSAIYSGGTEVSVKSAITSILSTLYPLEVEVGTEWYPDAGGSLGASDNPLENVKFATDNYRGERPDGDAFQSQLAVLRDLCIEQGLVVKQVERPGGARWLVAQRSAYNSDGTLKVWTYDTTGSLKSGEPSTRDRSLTLDVSGQDLLREHTREFVRRRQAVEVTHDHTPLDDFVGDGGFEDAGDGNTTPWSIGSTSKLSAQVVSHDGPDNTPSASQQNTYLLEISGSPDGGNNFPQDSFEFPVSQSLGEVTGAQPRTAGRIKQSFEGNKTVLTPKDEDGIAIRVSIGSYWLGVRSSSLTTDVKRGTGSLYCDPLDRPIPEGAALAVIKPNPPEDQPGNEFRGTITLSERAESGDTELVGDLSADFNTPMKVLYPSIESSQSVFPIQRFVDNPRTYPRFEIVFPFKDPSGGPLEGEITYEAGGIRLITEENTQSGTSYSADSVYLDDVEFALTRDGQDITQTVVEASVTELGEEEAQTARTFSGPTDQNLARLRADGFQPTNWGIGVGGGSLSLAELKARERLRYWRNHNEMFSVTGVDRDGTTQLTGDELVTLDGQTYTVHSIKYDAAKGETELTLIEYEDRGTSGITLETVLEQSDGAAGTSGGGGGSAVGGGGGAPDWDDLTGELSGPVPFDATDSDGNPTSRSLRFLNVTPQVDVTSDPASGIALEIKDQTNGNRLGTLTTDGRWETRADQEAFADGSFGSGASTNSLLQVEDAGTVLTTDAASLNFTGSGLSLSQSGDKITIDVSGGSGSDIDIESNQSVVVGGATGLSFEGSGIDSVDNDGDGTATVNISKGSSTEVQEGGTAQVSDVTVLDFVGPDFSVANPTGGEAEVSLQDDTVTVAGNPVSLGGATGIAHGDLSSIGSSDHHSRYADSEAVSAVNAETSLSVDIGGDADSVDGYQGSALAALSEDETISGAWDFQQDILLGENKKLKLRVNDFQPYDWVLTSQKANPNASPQYQSTNQILFRGASAGGVAESGSIVWDGGGSGGGPNSRLHLSATTQMERSTDGTNNFDQAAISINSSEQVGIGTTSPSFPLDVNGTAAANTLRLGDYTVEQDSSAGDLNFFHSGSKVLELTDGGILRAAGDVVAFGLSGGGGSGSTSGLQADAPLTLDTTTDPDTIGLSVGTGLTINNGTLEADGSVGVSSVFGRTGDVTASVGDYSASQISGFDEKAQDAVGTIMSGSGAASVAYDDAANTITISATDTDTQLSDSEVQTAINNDADHGSTASHNYFTASEARSAVEGTSDVADLVGGRGTSGQVAQTDGTGVSWVTLAASDVSGVSPDSNADAHHAVFEPADYNPVSDVEAHGSALAIDITGDADTLDGVEGGNYARTDQNERFTQNLGVGDSPHTRLTVTSNTAGDGALNVIPQSGSVVLKAEKNDYSDTGRTLAFSTQGGSGDTLSGADVVISGGNLGAGGQTAPSYALETAGDMRATGEIQAFLGSDRRLKTALDPLGSALDKVNQLTGYGFDWRKEDAVQPHKRGKTDVGLIAQEVEGVLPEAVQEFQDGHSEGYKGVSYEKLVPLLVEAIKDLRSQIEQV